MQSNNQPTPRAVVICKQDPGPLCPTGVLLELLGMQRDVDAHVAEMGLPKDPSDYRSLIVVLRGLGMSAMWKPDSCIAAWERHKTSGQPDIEYLKTIKASFTKVYTAMGQAGQKN